MKQSSALILLIVTATASITGFYLMVANGWIEGITFVGLLALWVACLAAGVLGIGRLSGNQIGASRAEVKQTLPT